MAKINDSFFYKGKTPELKLWKSIDDILGTERIFIMYMYRQGNLEGIKPFLILDEIINNFVDYAE